MSGISSSIGLVSGIDTGAIIDQLMAIESIPLIRLQAQVAELELQQAAFNTLLSNLSGIQTAVEGFSDISLFRRFNATSSNSDVLTATAGEEATPGTFNFRVHSLVSNHQLISTGFNDRDVTPVGSGTVTIEIGNGKLNPDTSVDVLNGGEGIRRGIIKITDRTGQSSEIDLTAVLTVNDVLSAINSATGIDVNARVSGDAVILEDTSGATEGELVVEDLGGDFAAEDLGIAGTAASGTITGGDIIDLFDTMPLSMLNDGNGIRTAKTGDDFQIAINDATFFDVSLSGRLDVDGNNALATLNSGAGVRLGTIRITDSTGASADIDLSEAQSVADVMDAINTAGIAVSAAVDGAGVSLQITDSGGGEGDLTIEDVEGFSAADLGILGEHDGTFVGEEIFRITTVGDALRAINYAYDQDGNSNGGGATVKAAISSDGNRIELSSPLPPGSTIAVNALEGSQAAEDLGVLGSFEVGASSTFEGQQILAGLNTVLLKSLNGGSGVALGAVQFTNRNGDPPTTIDFADSGAETVQDVLDAINEDLSASGVEASINAAGNGIAVQDTTEGTGDLIIEDVGEGTMASELGIAGTESSGLMNSGNLQLQYVSRATLLEDLNHGTGVAEGSFQITAADGSVHVVNVTGSQRDVGDIIDLINATTDGAVEASINSRGDGILLTDLSGGEGTLIVADLDGGFAAQDLNLVGEASGAGATIDGSYEIEVEIDADDTLDDVILKLNEASSDINAAVINDGGDFNPYLLSITSQVSGLDGELIFDAGTTGLSMGSLVKPQDAVVFLGDEAGDTSIVVQSSSNTLTEVLPDITIDLTAVSDDPVSLTIAQDVESVVEDISAFVSAYNATLDYIDEVTFFDSETLEQGVLFGDFTVNRVRDRLHDAVSGAFEGVPEVVDRLFEIGIDLVEDARLEFDDDQFREVYAANPDAVEVLFTLAETGLGEAVEQSMIDLTDSIDGLVPNRNAALGDQIDLLNDEIEDTEESLEIKQAQLEAEFVALESALAALQTQEAALTVLAGLAAEANGL